MKLSDLLLTSTSGSGIARLARVSLDFVENPNGDALKLAVRVVLEQLFQNEASARGRLFGFAASELSRHRSRWSFESGDLMFIDLVRAACLARTQREAEAMSIIADCRRRLDAELVPRWEEIGRLATSADVRDNVRANLLRDDVLEMECAFELIAGELVPTRAPGEAPVAPAPANVLSARERAPGRALVLVVDDDEDVRGVVSGLLEERGYSVVTAEHGARAVSVLEEGVKPDAILLDLMMPVMNGWQFYEWQMRSAHAALPTVVFTAAGVRQGVLGGAKIVSKNVDADVLVGEVARAIEKAA